MSSIPSSAMPHARSESSENESGESGGQASLATRAINLVRDNPKTAIAAGAAVAAGVAAAIPLARGRGKAGDKARKSRKS